MEISPSELRKDIYNLLDQVLETGVPLEINRKGKTLKIMPPQRVSKLAKLKPQPDCIIGDEQDLLSIDWSENWKPEI